MNLDPLWNDGFDDKATCWLDCSPTRGILVQTRKNAKKTLLLVLTSDSSDRLYDRSEITEITIATVTDNYESAIKMSLPDPEERTWTREELEALKRKDIIQAAKRFGLRANAKTVDIIKGILDLQQSKHAPPQPSPGPLTGPSPKLLRELSPGLSPKLSPEPPLESRPNHAPSVYEDPGKTVNSPPKAGSLGSNPSQDSASSHHLSLGTNTSPHKDKGKGKVTETAGAEQLKDSSGEFPGSRTSTLLQAASTSSEKKRKVKRRRNNPPHGGEPSLPQNPQPNQNSDSQVSVQQIVFVSDNSGSSLILSNSNQTASSNQSFHASFDSRLRKLETSASVESVRDQVSELQKDIESLKSELGTVKDQLLEVRTHNSELQEENARVLQHNNELQTQNADSLKEKAELKALVSSFNDRLIMLEELLKGKAPARSSNSSSTDPEGESALRLGSPQPIDEAKTPQPDTTPKALPRHLEGLEVASTSEHTAPRDSDAPFSLPAFPPLPPPNGTPSAVGAAEVRPGSHTPSGSRQSRPSSTPGGSHPLKRKLEEPETGPSVALDMCVSSKRSKPNSSPEMLVVAERQGGKAVRGVFTTPPNPPPANPPAHASIPPPDYPFKQGSPSPQQRRPPRPPATQDLRHIVPSPDRRPETRSSGTQPNTPPIGEAIYLAPVPVRGDDTRRTPERTSNRAGPNHLVGSSALASAGVFNPLSSSTPARPGPSSLVMRNSSTTSRLATRALPYERPPLINATAPPPPAIPAAGPPTESHGSGGSQSSDGTNSDRVEGANQVPTPEPVEAVSESVQVRMPPITGAQPSGALDPFRFTGAIQPLTSHANHPTTTTPDSSMRQMAPETPMASPTRYGTEINPSMRYLY